MKSKDGGVRECVKETERREGDRGREGKEGKSWEGKGEGNRGRRKKA